MLRHREKVLAHAEQQLRSQGALNAKDLLTLYKKFLKIENHRIALKHRAGEGGREICAQRASLLDIVLRHLLEHAMEGLPKAGKLPRIALVAVGGYGRGEMNLFSDVDIMFLHPDKPKKLDPRLDSVVEKILYTLWDAGFKVGHCTRSVSGAIPFANADMQSKTACLEARCSAGDAARRSTRQWLAGMIALKLVAAVILFPYYQHQYRGENYALAARDIIERASGHPLYTMADTASGLSVAGYIDARWRQEDPIQWPPEAWSTGFVIAEEADPAIGDISARFKLGGDELFLLCRGAACAGPAR